MPVNKLKKNTICWKFFIIRIFFEVQLILSPIYLRIFRIFDCCFYISCYIMLTSKSYKKNISLVYLEHAQLESISYNGFCFIKYLINLYSNCIMFLIVVISQFSGIAVKFGWKFVTAWYKKNYWIKKNRLSIWIFVAFRHGWSRIFNNIYLAMRYSDI